MKTLQRILMNNGFLELSYSIENFQKEKEFSPGIFEKVLDKNGL